VDVSPASTAAAPAGARAHRAEPHQQAIWRYLRMLGACPEEADDLMQETMLVGCSVELPAEPELAGAFLRGVARNHWLRSRRWWQRRREREIAAAVDELWSVTAADDGDELVDRLRHCVERLQPRARQALELHYHDGLHWPDVATRIGLKPNGTKTLVQRARQALRDCIERRHP
jgi:RNA polymerase sigma-70 factor (ECF subfamily)